MTNVKLIPFYLPQFHPIPENDEWWGKGFTEWYNVVRAKPQFEGHLQPRLPTELGFYDLRVADTIRQQAALAKAYGIHGFCFYYYWFSGHKLLETPLNKLTQHPDIDLPFCICWANENWTRRWDGRDQEILIEQSYQRDDPQRFIDDISSILHDPRYITIDGKKLLLIYRTESIPHITEWVDTVRTRARTKYQLELYLVRAERLSFCDPQSIGFDAAYEFPPLHCWGPIVQPQKPNPDFTGALHDYTQSIQKTCSRKDIPFTLFRGVMTAWDNTPRRKQNATIVHGSSPEKYKSWLRQAIDYTLQHRANPEERIVFINAWNEWAEGAYLEPDELYGRQYLEATKQALFTNNPRPINPPLTIGNEA